MSPLETLLESLSLIVEYGRIPLGNKLKITKTPALGSCDEIGSITFDTVKGKAWLGEVQ
jgi:hypothetical protein